MQGALFVQNYLKNKDVRCIKRATKMTYAQHIVVQ